MPTWRTTEPSNVVSWSTETSGTVVYRYKQGSYGYRFYSACAIARLRNNELCVRVKLYTSNYAGYNAAQQFYFHAWAGDSESPSERYFVGDGFSLKFTWYAVFPASYSEATIRAGAEDGSSGHTASSVTLTVPEKVTANEVYVKVGGVWKLSDAVYVKVNGVWQQSNGVYLKVNGEWIPKKEKFYVYNNGTAGVAFTNNGLDGYNLNSDGYLYAYFYVTKGSGTYTARANSTQIDMTDYSKLTVVGHATTSGTAYGLVGIGQSNTSTTNTTYTKYVQLNSSDTTYTIDLSDITGNQIISVGGQLQGVGNYKTYINQLILE